MNVLIWLLYFIPALAIELVCYLLAPIVACFVTSRLRTDYVKRIGKQYTMPRDYLITPLYWFQTHDNAVDEWWFGMYNVDHWFKFAREWTNRDHQRSPLIRYYCRVMWLWRNCAYGFHYALFSRPKELFGNVFTRGIEGDGFWYELKLYKYSFQFECHVPLGARYLSINIGWKAHKTTERLLYANRIIGFRKY
ncbi:MAG: hypothetical protein Q8J66_09060 [Methylotenera sp.]|nr:hypothetical protein [Methylotenera sp.]